MRKGGGERSCVRKSAKVGSIRAERNSSKAGSLNGEGEEQEERLDGRPVPEQSGADSFYGRPQRCCRDRQIGQPSLERRVWGGRCSIGRSREAVRRLGGHGGEKPCKDFPAGIPLPPIW